MGQAFGLIRRCVRAVTTILMIFCHPLSSAEPTPAGGNGPHDPVDVPPPPNQVVENVSPLRKSLNGLQAVGALEA